MGTRLYLKDESRWMEILGYSSEVFLKAKEWSGGELPESSEVRTMIHYLTDGFGKFDLNILDKYKGKYEGDKHCGETFFWMLISDLIMSSSGIEDFEFPMEVSLIAQNCGVYWD